MPTVQLKKAELARLYLKENKSARDIALFYSCSENKINYWLARYEICKRSISEAVYVKCNPNGDPFSFKEPSSLDESFLFGLGLGLYWGEGNKKNTHSVRLGNTDPRLIKYFIKFLTELYKVKKEKFTFGLQIFSDMHPQETLQFWVKTLQVPASRFGKVIITPSRGVGTYKEKTKFGVLTVYVSNKKLRDLICTEIDKLS